MGDRRVRPPWVTAVNRGEIAPIQDEADRPLTRGALLAEALALDGNDGGVAAFGDEAFIEPLDVFLGAVEDEAALTVLGRWLTRRFLLRLLVGRLQLERYVAADPGVVDEEIRAPVFIAGAPRTGTTILYDLMVQDPALRAPLGWELLRPVPPPQAGKGEDEEEDGRVELAEAELRMLARVAPAMDAIHEYGARRPKECLSAMSFELRSEELTARYHVPSYVAWFQKCDMRPAYERHKLVLQVLQRRRPTERWVLKSPAHLHQLPALLDVYPDARLAFTHRDPLVVLASVSSLVANLRWVHSDHVDLADIGRYHADLFGRSLDDLARRDAAGELQARAGAVGHGRYADFVERPLDTVKDLYGQLGLQLTAETEARMAGHLAARPKGHRGDHRYDFDDLGLDRAATRDRFDRYVRHFDVPAEELAGRPASPILRSSDRHERSEERNLPTGMGSAARLAQQMGSRLPEADSVPPEAFALVERVRQLVEATALTDVPPGELAAAADQVAAVTELLRSRQRDHLHLVRHPDGRVESLRQAGSGRLNPQAVPVEWVRRPTEPPPGTPPEPVEVLARCTFTAAHGGSPGRTYGGVIAVVLDEVAGVALRAAGATGMTVALNVSLRGAVPLGVPVDVAARYTGGEGRKSFATAEMTVDGTVVAEAQVLWVAERTGG